MKNTKNERNDDFINLRLPAQARLKIVAKARAAELSVGAWVRQILKKELEGGVK